MPEKCIEPGCRQQVPPMHNAGQPFFAPSPAIGGLVQREPLPEVPHLELTPPSLGGLRSSRSNGAGSLFTGMPSLSKPSASPFVLGQSQGFPFAASTQMTPLNLQLGVREMMQQWFRKEAAIRNWLDEHLLTVSGKHEDVIVTVIRNNVRESAALANYHIKDVIKAWAKDRKVPIISPMNISQPMTPPQSTGSGIGEMLNLKVKIQGVEINVAIPESVKVQLPIKLTESKVITVSIEQEAAGSSKVSVSAGGFVSGFDIGLTGSVQSYGEDQGQVGVSLNLTSAKKRCAISYSDKKALEEKSNKVVEAFNSFVKPESIALKPGEERPTELKLLFKLAGSVGDLYKAIDENNKTCDKAQKPRMQFNVKGTYDTMGDKKGNFGVMFGVTFHF